ncbi:MAG TPA: hypothetical protein VEM76_10495, partial [Anaeromyxobacteraceae bacterium]|nr:hypothetical protein [Anaeromyxobacteraceae bacterium]
ACANGVGAVTLGAMQILKILALVLGLAAVAFTAKVALTGTTGASDPAAPSQPKRQLDAVRARAGELEQELQKSANRADAER